ncbi:hypothetical protein EIP91_010699 [Steccherinum ochraceum]|uniref:Uncharacterized protein n=1 Tax=Steccherinum ochraceum TaxID=92696 RepID=A0A4R0R8W6_9APHY|nr:hypothetical protein EIP91_010699 [Steccherinum ochraceum]
MPSKGTSRASGPGTSGKAAPTAGVKTSAKDRGKAGGAKGSKNAEASDASDGSEDSDDEDEDDESGSGSEGDGEPAADPDADGEDELEEDELMADATLQNPADDDDGQNSDDTMDVDEGLSAKDRGGQKRKARELGDVTVSPKGKAKGKGRAKEKGKARGRAGKADSKPQTKAAAAAAKEGAEYEEEKTPKRTAEEIAEAKAAAAETILKKVSEIDVAADYDEESPHQLKAGEAFLGYGFGYLRSGWKGAMFRAVNARSVDKKNGTEEMLSRWLVRAPDYLDENTAVPVLIPGKYIDQGPLRKIYNSASQLEELKISGEDEPDFRMMVLGGNHRREVFVKYLEKLEGIVNTVTKLEASLLKKLKGAKAIDTTEGTQQKLKDARERKAQAQKLVDRGAMWVFKVYDYDKVNTNVMHFLARNTDRVEQRARAMEMVWEDMRDIWLAEEEKGLKRGTAAWTSHITHATLRTKKNYEKIIKSPVYHDFLQDIGVFAYWRSGGFLSTTFLSGPLMRHKYGGLVIHFMLMGKKRMEEVVSVWEVGNPEVRAAWFEKRAHYRKIVAEDTASMIEEEQEKQSLTPEEKADMEKAEAEGAAMDAAMKKGMEGRPHEKWVPQIHEKLDDVWQVATKKLSAVQRPRVLFEPYSKEWDKVMDSYTTLAELEMKKLLADAKFFRPEEKVEILRRMRLCLIRRDRPRMPIITASVVKDFLAVMKEYEAGVNQVIRWIDPWVDFVANPAKKNADFCDPTWILRLALEDNAQIRDLKEADAMGALIMCILENRRERLYVLDTAVRWRLNTEYPWLEDVLNITDNALMDENGYVENPLEQCAPQADRHFFWDNSVSATEEMMDDVDDLITKKFLPEAGKHSRKFKNMVGGVDWSMLIAGSQVFEPKDLKRYPPLRMLTKTMAYHHLAVRHANPRRDVPPRVFALFIRWGMYLNVTLPIETIAGVSEMREEIRLALVPFAKPVLLKVTYKNIAGRRVQKQVEVPLFKYWDHAVHDGLLKNTPPIKNFRADATWLQFKRGVFDENAELQKESKAFYSLLERMVSARAFRNDKDKYPKLTQDVVKAGEMFISSLAANVSRRRIRDIDDNAKRPILSFIEDTIGDVSYAGQHKQHKDPLSFASFEDAKKYVDALSADRRGDVEWSDNWTKESEVKDALVDEPPKKPVDPEDDPDADYEVPALSARVTEPTMSGEEALQAAAVQAVADAKAAEEAEEAAVADARLKEEAAKAAKSQATAGKASGSKTAAVKTGKERTSKTKKAATASPDSDSDMEILDDPPSKKKKAAKSTDGAKKATQSTTKKTKATPKAAAATAVPPASPPPHPDPASSPPPPPEPELVEPPPPTHQSPGPSSSAVVPPERSAAPPASSAASSSSVPPAPQVTTPSTVQQPPISQPGQKMPGRVAMLRPPPPKKPLVPPPPESVASSSQTPAEAPTQQADEDVEMQDAEKMLSMGKRKIPPSSPIEGSPSPPQLSQTQRVLMKLQDMREIGSLTDPRSAPSQGISQQMTRMGLDESGSTEVRDPNTPPFTQVPSREASVPPAERPRHTTEPPVLTGAEEIEPNAGPSMPRRRRNRSATPPVPSHRVLRRNANQVAQPPALPLVPEAPPPVAPGRKRGASSGASPQGVVKRSRQRNDGNEDGNSDGGADDDMQLEGGHEFDGSDFESPDFEPTDAARMSPFRDTGRMNLPPIADDNQGMFGPTSTRSIAVPSAPANTGESSRPIERIRNPPPEPSNVLKASSETTALLHQSLSQKRPDDSDMDQSSDDGAGGQGGFGM